jgi:hypothetical protein
VSIQYLQHPIAELCELRRTLRPGAPVVISFSNRCFPAKAVAVWLTLGCQEHQRLVSLFLWESGWGKIMARVAVPPGRRGDPLWIVTGRV